MFLGKGVLKIYSKFTGEHHANIEIALHHWYPVNLLHIFRRPIPKNTSRGLLLTGAVLRILLDRFTENAFKKKEVSSQLCLQENTCDEVEL